MTSERSIHTTEPDPTRPELLPLGWDRSLESHFVRLLAAGGASAASSPARVVAEHRGTHLVSTGPETRRAVLAGRLRRSPPPDGPPAVGDWVALVPRDGAAVIEAVLPRRTAFRRKVAGEETAPQIVAANVDVALVAAALDGEPNLRRLERYLTLAWESGASPVVALTKADLHPDPAGAAAAVRSVSPGVEVIAVSAATGAGLDALRAFLPPGRTAVLLGPSGAGKSTLVNRLLGEDRLRTQAVRADGKGRHTTTHRELVRLGDGALLIDTPGMRELQLWSAEDGLGRAFADIEELAAGCRFRDCGHEAEPGCAVREAVAAGRLPPERLEHWLALRRELAYLERRRDDAAAAEERARWKSAQRAYRARVRGKYGGGDR